MYISKQLQSNSQVSENSLAIICHNFPPYFGIQDENSGGQLTKQGSKKIITNVEITIKDSQSTEILMQ